MATSQHLWAIGFDEIGRADQVRKEIANLAEKHCLILLDSAVVARYLDGCVTLDGERFAAVPSLTGRTFARFLAGLALAVPLLTGAAVGAFQSAIGATAAATVGIGEDFVRQVEELMKPGTSALFVLDQEGDMDALLKGIRGLGGTVLKTTVDLERAMLIQATLAASPVDGQ
jgi:uncharacterized membrane protein